MVFVQVRETFDLHTIKDKMTVIGIHTPKAELIKRNFPGLLLQCKAYRPVSCDVTIACASMLPADPLQVSTTEGDIAPEDLFNPILYKATTNMGLSQIEARIQALGTSGNSSTIDGNSAQSLSSGLSNLATDFDIYYGLLADAHGWRHANPQSGLQMKGLKPLVYEMLYSVGDNKMDANTKGNLANVGDFSYPDADSAVSYAPSAVFKGHAKPMPFINCTAYTADSINMGFEHGQVSETSPVPNTPTNHSTFVPAPRVYCGVLCIPPSRLHELFYRMVVTWTLEFSMIRSVGELGSWQSLASIGLATHQMDYDFSSAKQVAGLEDTLVDTNDDAGSVSANVEVKKVM